MTKVKEISLMLIKPNRSVTVVLRGTLALRKLSEL